MRTVKHRTHAIQGDTNAGPGAFTDLGFTGLHQRLYRAPLDVGSNRISKDGDERRAVSTVR